mmetsp:Transcript_29449/g.43021  ORF Transcript_29449/g.43021 Transcript_29449/m.43021 type:complete len:189 (+) Transcript_29449:82-648(+)
MTMHLFSIIVIVITALLSVRVEGNVITLTIDEFYTGVQNNAYDAILDVRTTEEYDSTGHIANATFIESLAGYSKTEAKELLDGYGCQGSCLHIAIYCQSGGRAGRAATLLRDAGFNGTLYNGLGVGQWTAAGYPLVTSPSVEPTCGKKNCSEPLDAPTTSPAPVAAAISHIHMVYLAFSTLIFSYIFY